MKRFFLLLLVAALILVGLQNIERRTEKSSLVLIQPPDALRPQVANARYSPDGRWIVTEVSKIGVGRAVVAISLADLRVEGRWNHGERTVFAPSGASLAFQSSPQSLGVWDLQQGFREISLPAKGRVNELKFSPDGRRLAAFLSADNGRPYLAMVNLETPELLWGVEYPYVESLAYSEDAKLLAVSGGARGGVQVLQVDSGKAQYSVAQMHASLDLVFGKDSKTLVGLDERGLFKCTLPEMTVVHWGSVELGSFLSKERPIAVPELRCHAKDRLLIQTYADTVLLDTRSGDIVSTWKETLRHQLSENGQTLWLEKRDGGVEAVGLSQSGEISTNVPAEFRRPLRSARTGNLPRSSLTVVSPKTGQDVVAFEFLDLDSNLKFEWVAWTGEGDYIGSTRWRNFAQPVRTPEKSERREAILQAFEAPSALTQPLNQTSIVLGIKGVSSQPVREASALLDRVVEVPGQWNQMCSLPSEKPPTRLPLFGYHRDWVAFWVSADDFATLRLQRDVIVQEISLRLAPLIPEVLARQTDSGKARVTTVGTLGDPLETYLMILLDLNGVEAFPELLRLEAALDGLNLYPAPDVSTRTNEKGHIILGGYDDHVQVLSVITALLVNEGVLAVKELGESETLYDKHHRDRIVTLAGDFLKATEPAKFRGAAAMSKELTYR